MIWQCGKFSLGCSPKKPLIMGICNVTPDSFSDGGDFNTTKKAVEHACELIEQGADIIDVGGESTRPGSAEVASEEELARILPVVEKLAAKGFAVSVDTRHASVAKACLEAGACIINDVSGFRDAHMQEVLASSNAGAVIMHMQGQPKIMQEAPHYDDVVSEVEKELLDAAVLLEARGVSKQRICIDPGIGFGKTHEHNRALINASISLASHGFPLMVAVSRKSYIGQVSAIDAPKERDLASALCAAYACECGASIIRAHNVCATKEALKNSKRAIIALGSNMGNAQKNLDKALLLMAKTPGIWVGSVSSYVQSEPAYYLDQENFVNAVCKVQTTLEPKDLLTVLQGIENIMGRKREIKNGPRCIDLDILDYEDCVLDEVSAFSKHPSGGSNILGEHPAGDAESKAGEHPVDNNGEHQLTLPHPRILEREFVVKPLLEICPNYVLADKTPVALKENAIGKITATLRKGR